MLEKRLHSFSLISCFLFSLPFAATSSELREEVIILPCKRSVQEVSTISSPSKKYSTPEDRGDELLKTALSPQTNKLSQKQDASYFVYPLATTALLKLFSNLDVRESLVRSLSHVDDLKDIEVIKLPSPEKNRFLLKANSDSQGVVYLSFWARHNISRFQWLFRAEVCIETFFTSTLTQAHKKILKRSKQQPSLYDAYHWIELIDMNWDKPFSIENSIFPKDLEHTYAFNNDQQRFVSQAANNLTSKDRFIFRGYFIPAFNEKKFPSLRGSYFSTLTPQEVWFYFFKHIYFHATIPLRYKGTPLEVACQLLNMIQWDSKSLEDYAEQLKDNTSYLEDDFEIGAKTVLDIWPFHMKERPPQLNDFELAYSDIFKLTFERALEAVWEFERFLKCLEALKENNLEPDDKLTFQLILRREDCFYSKLQFVLRVMSAHKGAELMEKMKEMIADDKTVEDFFLTLEKDSPETQRMVEYSFKALIKT